MFEVARLGNGLSQTKRKRGDDVNTEEVMDHALSITELAQILGRDRKTVAAIVRPLTPTPDSSKTRKNYTVRTLLRALDNPQELNVNQMTPAERRAHWQAENERLKYESSRRFLIPADECRREYTILAKSVVYMLESLPDLLERDCGLPPGATAYVQKVIDDFRDDLAVAVEQGKFNDDDVPGDECEEEGSD